MRRANIAFTAPEMLIALTITAVIGLSIAGFSTALSTACATTQDAYVGVQTARAAMLAMQHNLSRAKLVTSIAPQRMAYWAGDLNGDGLINLSEIVVLNYDAARGTLEEHRVIFPQNIAPATRQSLDRQININTITNVNAADSAVAASSYNQTITLAQGVAGFEASAWPACPEARVVRLKLTVGTGDEQLVLRSAACLRADRTACVESSGGAYVLNAAPVKGGEN